MKTPLHKTDWTLLCVLLIALVPVFFQAEARQVRVATYNVLNGVGAVGSTEYLAVRDTLQRIDADIVAFQELQTGDRPNWEAMAAELGYGYTSFGIWAPLSGSIYVGYFSRYPILESFHVLSPPGANEISRPPHRVVVDIPDAASPLVLWALHHKALSGAANDFRRAVEAYRCIENIDQYLDANPSHLEYVVLGDMNADIRQSQPAFFSSLPSGLPASYSLGADITFPVYYATFPRDAYEVAGDGMVMLDAVQGSTTNPGTFISSNGRLDYIFVSSNLFYSPLGPSVAEVYNSALDDDVTGLPKSGSPLPASTSTTASDHFLVFADIHMTDATLLGVAPISGVYASGLAGGPFSPNSWTYTVSNPSPTSVVWSVATPDWLNADPVGGTIATGESVTVSLAVDPVSTAYTVGSYAGELRFTDHTSGGAIVRPARLDVLPEASLDVSPAGPIYFTGLEGGPFLPGETVLILTNTGFSELIWQGLADGPIEIAPPSGSLEPGSWTQIVVSISSVATNLPLGVYPYAIQIDNMINGQGSTTLDVQVVVLDALGLFENGETGGAGWTSSGLWHLTDTTTSVCARARNGTGSWWYGREDICTYNTGAANTGSLTSPEFVVPPNAYLTYWSWEQTEGQGLSWDKRLIQISTNGGSTWATIYQSSVSAAQWQSIAVDLGGYAMSTARLRFVFDSVDDFANDFPGWFVDDIRVAPAGSLAAAPGAIRYEGPAGGPFTPMQAVLTVTNAGTAPVVWSLTNSPSWVTASAQTGFLDPLAHTNINLVLNGNSSNLVGGLYAAHVEVRNAMGGSGTTNLLVELLVRDGLPDDWRLIYFGHIEPREAELSRDVDDPDEDGYSNWEEYVAGTNPLDDEDFFSGALGLTPAFTADGVDVLLINTKTNRLYDLYWTDRLEDGTEWVPMGRDEPGTGGDLWLPVSQPGDAEFYRPAVKLP